MKTTPCKLAMVSAALMALLTAGAGFGADKPAEAASEAGVPPAYPLQKCVVSDEKLGEMGKAYKVTHDGTDVYLCCKACLKDFNKEPEKYVKMVKEAEKTKKKP